MTLFCIVCNKELSSPPMEECRFPLHPQERNLLLLGIVRSENICPNRVRAIYGNATNSSFLCYSHVAEAALRFASFGDDSVEYTDPCSELRKRTGHMDVEMVLKGLYANWNNLSTYLTHWSLLLEIAVPCFSTVYSFITRTIHFCCSRSPAVINYRQLSNQSSVHIKGPPCPPVGEPLSVDSQRFMEEYKPVAKRSRDDSPVPPDFPSLDNSADRSMTSSSSPIPPEVTSGSYFSYCHCEISESHSGVNTRRRVSIQNLSSSDLDALAQFMRDRGLTVEDSSRSVDQPVFNPYTETDCQAGNNREEAPDSQDIMDVPAGGIVKEEHTSERIETISMVSEGKNESTPPSSTDIPHSTVPVPIRSLIPSTSTTQLYPVPVITVSSASGVIQEHNYQIMGGAPMLPTDSPALYMPGKGTGYVPYLNHHDFGCSMRELTRRHHERMRNESTEKAEQRRIIDIVQGMAGSYGQVRCLGELDLILVGSYRFDLSRLSGLSPEGKQPVHFAGMIFDLLTSLQSFRVSEYWQPTRIMRELSHHLIVKCVDENARHMFSFGAYASSSIRLLRIPKKVHDIFLEILFTCYGVGTVLDVEHTYLRHAIEKTANRLVEMMFAVYRKEFNNARRGDFGSANALPFSVSPSQVAAVAHRKKLGLQYDKELERYLR